MTIPNHQPLTTFYCLLSLVYFLIPQSAATSHLKATEGRDLKGALAPASHLIALHYLTTNAASASSWLVRVLHLPLLIS